MNDALAHRKSQARLRILTPDGTPAAFRNVAIKQTAHKLRL